LSDRDGGGSISKEELGQLMETLGIHASPDEIDMMVNEIDKNNDGEIQFEGA
jgi:calmodulin